ncbi:MRG-binding protein-like [Acyrthosiphon pisum]|uniref:ACYPI007565 protein n=1 Tax=Acyrthosiphon pisum TaxID=7029 RepID=C4WSZ1_ACYPI|nr:MRG-binding protein-like [Acyrthosiphon pisum]BAH71011.1 ACYPI007565 [Acyrthosiphon pisum]|eukprot:NP_001155720.1 MRG-binding protein-like [Acyrthosiphon pisum]
MARRRRNPKLKHKATQGNDSLAKRTDFVWTTERKIALLQCMIKRKPAGLLKHINMLIIKSHLSERLQMDVPIKEIWRFLHSYWNMDEVDKIENQAMPIKKKDFELPQTEEWINLIKEQGDLIDSNNMNTDAMKQTSQAAISNVDLKTLKSVKIMVERLDNSMYAHKLPKIK